MKIAIDCFWWSVGPPSGRLVVREIVNAWTEKYPEDELNLSISTKHAAELQAAFPLARITRLRMRPHALAVIFELPMHRVFRESNLTLTQNFAPILGQGAIFVHDAIYLSNPEWFTRKERVYLSLSRISLVLSRASIVTSSKTEAKRISRYFRPRKLVTAVGLAVSTDLVSSQATIPNSMTGVKRFLLSVGRLNDRKNLSRVLQAAAISTQVSVDLPLVIVGEESGMTSGLDIAIKASSDEHVIFLGKVTDGELRWLYENGSALVYLSLEEGYGLPPIEARHFGMPVLLSDLPVFHETNGKFARYVDPTKVEAIALAIDGMLLSGTSIDTGVSRIDNWSDVVGRIRQTATIKGGA